MTKEFSKKTTEQLLEGYQKSAVVIKTLEGSLHQVQIDQKSVPGLPVKLDPYQVGLNEDEQVERFIRIGYTIDTLQRKDIVRKLEQKSQSVLLKLKQQLTEVTLLQKRGLLHDGVAGPLRSRLEERIRLLMEPVQSNVSVDRSSLYEEDFEYEDYSLSEEEEKVKLSSDEQEEFGEYSPVEFDEKYTYPDGRTIRGIKARILHRLDRARLTGQPITKAQLKEDLGLTANMSAISGHISLLRQEIEDYGWQISNYAPNKRGEEGLFALSLKRSDKSEEIEDEVPKVTWLTQEEFDAMPKRLITEDEETGELGVEFVEDTVIKVDGVTRQLNFREVQILNYLMSRSGHWITGGAISLSILGEMTGRDSGIGSTLHSLMRKLNNKYIVSREEGAETFYCFKKPIVQTPPKVEVQPPPPPPQTEAEEPSLEESEATLPVPLFPQEITLPSGERLSREELSLMAISLDDLDVLFEKYDIDQFSDEAKERIQLLRKSFAGFLDGQFDKNQLTKVTVTTLQKMNRLIDRPDFDSIHDSIEDPLISELLLNVALCNDLRGFVQEVSILSRSFIWTTRDETLYLRYPLHMIDQEKKSTKNSKREAILSHDPDVEEHLKEILAKIDSSGFNKNALSTEQVSQIFGTTPDKMKEWDSKFHIRRTQERRGKDLSLVSTRTEVSIFAYLASPDGIGLTKRRIKGIELILQAIS